MKYLLLYLLLLFFFAGKAQTAGKPASLHQLLLQAESNYPSLQSKQFSVDAAKRSVEISKNTSLPSLDASYQLNYATHNNITGMLYPQFVMPISGPPSATNNFGGVFGSATSLLLNWQPVTFGQREAQVSYSQAGVVQANADLANEILQHKIKTANAYLDVLTTNELVKIYTENINRSTALFSTTKTLVDAGIKPGVDTVLFSAEIDKAKLEWINGKKNHEQAIIFLKQLLASESLLIIDDSSYFHKLPLNYTITDTIAHPLLSIYESNIELDKAKRTSIAKTTMPSLGVWGTTYARGSGVQADGSTKTLDGLGLQRINYGLGLQISMPLLQSAKIKPQLAQQDLQIKADKEKLNEVNSLLNSQQQSAENMLKYALTSIKENNALISSAEYAYTTILSRYTAGLANYADVVQTQYNLVKAQTDHKLSYMSVWKALLYKAAATGNLNLFLTQVN